jgi:hypothetical protein
MHLVLISITPTTPAFTENPERQLAEVLRRLADRIEQQDPAQEVYDLRGTPCGRIEIY